MFYFLNRRIFLKLSPRSTSNHKARKSGLVKTESFTVIIQKKKNAFKSTLAWCDDNLFVFMFSSYKMRLAIVLWGYRQHCDACWKSPPELLIWYYVLDVFQADIETKILEMDREIKVRAKISEAAKFYRTELVSHAF